MSNIKVAIIDDHDVVRNGLKIVLESFDNLRVTYSTKDSVAFLKSLPFLEEKPHVAIVDLHIDEMCGFSLTEQLSKEYPNIKIIIYTFLDEHFIVRTAFCKGAHAFINKNESAHNMYNVVKYVLSGNYYYKKKLNQKELISLKRKNSKNGRFTANVAMTEREKQIIKLVCRGLLYKNIADELGLSKRTIESYITTIQTKIGGQKVNDIITYAIKMGWDK